MLMWFESFFCHSISYPSMCTLLEEARMMMLVVDVINQGKPFVMDHVLVAISSRNSTPIQMIYNTF